MTGEDGKRGGGGGTGDVTSGANVNANVTDNANVNANISVSQQNGGPEKAPVVGGSNVETLPRAGKQVRFHRPLVLISTPRTASRCANR